MFVKCIVIKCNFNVIGENGSKTHGPNAVHSMLHHAFENFGYGEMNCVIHADNCAGKVFGRNINSILLIILQL